MISNDAPVDTSPSITRPPFWSRVALSAVGMVVVFILGFSLAPYIYRKSPIIPKLTELSAECKSATKLDLVALSRCAAERAMLSGNQEECLKASYHEHECLLHFSSAQNASSFCKSASDAVNCWWLFAKAYGRPELCLLVPHSGARKQCVFNFPFTLAWLSLFPLSGIVIIFSWTILLLAIAYSHKISPWITGASYGFFSSFALLLSGRFMLIHLPIIVPIFLISVSFMEPIVNTHEKMIPLLLAHLSICPPLYGVLFGTFAIRKLRGIFWAIIGGNILLTLLFLYALAGSFN